jgi:hypothetical protein
VAGLSFGHLVRLTLLPLSFSFWGYIRDAMNVPSLEQQWLQFPSTSITTHWLELDTDVISAGATQRYSH